MKYLLPLTKKDFDSLSNTKKFDKQFNDDTDCPICRACIRLGLNVAYVISWRIKFLDGSSINIKGEKYEVNRCRKELRDGAEKAYIEMMP